MCHAYHLTSRGAVATTQPEAEAVKPKEPGPTLADLDWSPALDPKPKPARVPKRPKPPKPNAPPFRLAKCVGPVGKDKRVPLVVEGRLVKSTPVKDPGMRRALKAGIEVKVSVDEPIVVFGIEEAG